MHARKRFSQVAFALTAAISSVATVHANVGVVPPDFMNFLRNSNGATVIRDVEVTSGALEAEVELAPSTTYLTVNSYGPTVVSPFLGNAVVGQVELNLANYRNVSDTITVLNVSSSTVAGTATVPIVVGYANAHAQYTSTDRTLFGTQLNAPELYLNDSYAGFQSKVTTEGAADQDILGNSVTSTLTMARGTEATIHMGSAFRMGGVTDPGVRLVSMAWRAALTGGSPSTPDGSTYDYLTPTVIGSDVLHLDGMAPLDEPTIAGGRKESDVYVLELSYDPTVIAPNSVRFSWLDLGANGLVERSDIWVDAGANVIGIGSYVYDGVFASWQEFRDDEDDIRDIAFDQNPITENDLHNYVGSWGIDTVGHKVWAVLDYTDAQFAVTGAPAAVPEPASLGVLALGAIALLRRRRS